MWTGDRAQGASHPGPAPCQVRAGNPRLSQPRLPPCNRARRPAEALRREPRDGGRVPQAEVGWYLQTAGQPAGWLRGGSLRRHKQGALV